MPDESTTVAALREAVRRFAAERAWEPYHSPKNLSMALAAEVAELMEHFLWIDSEASREVISNPARREAISEEIADIAGLVLNLCNTLGVDLSEAMRAKIAKNELKYPVDQYRGRHSVED
jgi:NTP pyrophosphatase (non-canonical NTP hydrolase)